MLNLKLKLPLLALSISTALIAPQIASAAPIKILPLGDSITNGLQNEGNDEPVVVDPVTGKPSGGNVTAGTKLSYRDDLYDLLKASGKVYGTDYVFEGSCPDATDTHGSCNAKKPNHDGKVLKHEGRAGYHANDINSELNHWLEDNYNNVFPDVALIHIGTNDIFNGEKPASTRNVDIKGIVDKLLAKYPDMEIYIAKILPMGETTSGPVAIGTDAAAPLNALLTQAWANATWPGKNIKIVDMNKGIKLNSTFFTSDLVHPKQKTEAIMAKRWFDAMNIAPVIADPATSSLTVDKNTISADNKDSAIITLDAKDAAGKSLSNPTIEFIINNGLGEAVVIKPKATTNSDGTYSAVLTSDNIFNKEAIVIVKVNGVSLKKPSGSTEYVKVKLLAGQIISFTPPVPAKGAVGDELTLTAISQKYKTSETTGLKNITLTSADTTVCAVENNKKVKLLKVGNCALTASQTGGTAGDITYGATILEKTIEISKGKQAITFDANTPKTGFIGGSFVPKASSTSGLAVAFTVAPKTVCSIASNKVTFKVAGVCKVIASQAGDANYSTASVVANIKVSDDKITLPSITDKTVGDNAFTVTAKSTSGAAVTLTASPANVCTVSGSQVSIGKSAGTCKLTAKTTNAEATTTFSVKKNASQLAIDTVGKVIASGKGKITVTQLEPIKGLKNLKKGTDYTKALKAGTYADKSNPTVAELQTVIDKVNKDNNKSGGSTSPAWLLMLGFVALYRRKKQS